MNERFLNIPIFREGRVYVNDIDVTIDFAKPPDIEEPEIAPRRYKIPLHIQNHGKYFYRHVQNTDIITADKINLDMSKSYNATVHKIDGFHTLGSPKNILKEEVVNSNKSDIYIGKPEIYTEPIKISVNIFFSDLWGDFWNNPTFIASRKDLVIGNYYAFLGAFVGKLVWIKSIPDNMYNLFICNVETKPVSVQLSVDGQNIIRSIFTFESIYTPNIYIPTGDPIIIG
jgi:hypothetical protein